jgi:hypothetical protein
MHSFPANTETLLVAAWLASSPQRHGAIIQKDPEQALWHRTDGTKIIASLLEEELRRIDWDSVCGPVYQRMIRHSIARVELDILTWAIRGEAGIYFKEGYLPSHPDKTREEEAARPETAILWEAITANERLLRRLKRMSQQWQSNLRQGAQALRIYFRLHTPLLMIRPTTTSFLMLELLLFSLEQIDWGEIAASLLGMPYVAGSVQPEDMQEEVMWPATLKALVWQAYTTFGEFSQKAELSTQLRQICLELADQCCQTHRRIRTLEDGNTVYAN